MKEGFLMAICYLIMGREASKLISPNDNIVCQIECKRLVHWVINMSNLDYYLWPIVKHAQKFILPSHMELDVCDNKEGQTCVLLTIIKYILFDTRSEPRINGCRWPYTALWLFATYMIYDDGVCCVQT